MSTKVGMFRDKFLRRGLPEIVLFQRKRRSGGGVLQRRKRWKDNSIISLAVYISLAYRRVAKQDCFWS